MSTKKTQKTSKTAKQQKPETANAATDTGADNSPITFAEIRRMQAENMDAFNNIYQVLLTIEELLKDIRSNQVKWPLELNDHERWDKQTTPPDDPPSTIRWPAHPPCGPRWPTDPWGNPAPYAVYCGGGEGPQCQRR